jgi:hypothetical protein
MFSAQLRERGIVRHPDTTLRRFPASGQATPHVQIQNNVAGEEFDFYITRYQVELVTARGRRTIHQYGHPYGSPDAPADETAVGPSRVDVPGYLQSPYGPARPC